MKHSGKASHAARKLLLVTFIGLLVILGVGVAAKFIGSMVAFLASGLFLVWVLFAIFTLYFFRDPSANAPAGAGLLVSPAHGTIDVIDETTEPQFMGGTCKRVSIFLSVVDVHVQKAPVAGKVIFLKHTIGKFLNAMKTDSALHNENVLIGFESSDRGEKIGVRLIAGLIARRIIPWISVGDDVGRGERISLIQFGSRCDLYFPPDYQIRVRLGDKAIGGETILAAKG